MRRALSIYIGIFALFLVSMNIYGQQGKKVITAINEKNQLLAICFLVENHTNNYLVLNIYRLDSNQWIQSFELKMPGSGNIEKLEFSSGGELIALKKGLNIAVFDVFNGKLVNSYKNAYDLVFSNNNSFFVYSNEFGLTKCDFYTGREIQYYNSPKSLKLKGPLFISGDDQYIYTREQHKVYLWKPEKTNLYKQFGASDIRMSNKEIILLRKRFSFVSVDVYDKRKLSRKSTFSSKVYIRDHVKETDKKKLDLVLEKCHLSQDGTYVTFFFNKRNKYEIHFVDTRTGEAIFILDKGNFRDIQKTEEYSWIGNHQMLIRLSTMNYYYVDLEQNRIKSGFEPFVKDNRLFRSADQIISFSPDRKFSTLKIIDEMQTKIRLKSNFKGDIIDLENVEDIGFTSNSQYYIFGMGNRSYCYKLYDYSENRIIELPDSLLEKKAEKMMLFREVIPEGYHYQRLKGIKHISEVTDSTFLTIGFKNVISDDSFSYINLHLIDQYGYYYQGASEEDWLFIWCNILLKEVLSKKVKSLKDFEVIEKKEIKDRSFALAMILDHSGSMGEERAMSLQTAATDFVYTMGENVSLAIIKYDENIGIEVNLTNNKRELVEILRPIGLEYYGGGTSMLDAINRGIDLLTAQKQEQKAIILFTDGKENSSYYSKNDVILNAIKRQIPVYTIGYGDLINEEDLKTISHYTNGGFYHIHQSADFEWIFQDVFNKVNNHYTIKFRTDAETDYAALVEVCFDNFRKDTVIIAFEHQKIKTEDIENQNTFNLNWENVDIEDFTNMVKFDEVEKNDYERTEKIFRKKTEEIAFEDSLRILNEFERIRLPNVRFQFDQDVLVRGSEIELKVIVEFLNKYPQAVIEIQGHTDSKGSIAYNTELSRKRALAMKNILVTEGINEDRLIVKSYGEKKPVASNKSEKGRARNRRVEFKIISLY